MIPGAALLQSTRRRPTHRRSHGDVRTETFITGDPMPKLAGKFALVTGGNSGIGLAAAQLFAAEGAQLAITGRELNTLASAAESVGGGAVAIPGDITATPDRERLFDTIK